MITIFNRSIDWHSSQIRGSPERLDLTRDFGSGGILFLNDAKWPEQQQSSYSRKCESYPGFTGGSYALEAGRMDSNPALSPDKFPHAPIVSHCI